MRPLHHDGSGGRGGCAGRAGIRGRSAGGVGAGGGGAAGAGVGAGGAGSVTATVGAAAAGRATPRRSATCRSSSLMRSANSSSLRFRRFQLGPAHLGLRSRGDRHGSCVGNLRPRAPGRATHGRGNTERRRFCPTSRARLPRRDPARSAPGPSGRTRRSRARPRRAPRGGRPRLRPTRRAKMLERLPARVPMTNSQTSPSPKWSKEREAEVRVLLAGRAPSDMLRHRSGSLAAMESRRRASAEACDRPLTGR